MSVESSSVSSAPKSAASGEVGHVKGKARAPGAAATDDSGGFASLLMTLGADDAGDLVSGQGQDAYPPMLAGKDKDALPDPELLLAQAMQLLPVLPPSAAAPGPADHSATELVLQTGTADRKRDGDALRLKQDKVATQAMESLVAKQEAAKPATTGDATRDVMTEVPLAHRGAPKSHFAEETAQSGKGRLAAEEHANKLLHAENRLAQSSALPQMTLAAGISEPGARRTERETERLALKQIGGSESGAWGHQALLEAGRIDPPSATTGTAALPPEMMVAEQVNYWIGRNVQNAELKLDGWGEGSVKVNISLNGNEARVEFRTDQVETRQVLEGAVSHLRDLLGNEGLVLTSVSVGTSGSGGTESREGRPPQRSRQAAVVVPQASLVDTVGRPARLSGRTVDLFV